MLLMQGSVCLVPTYMLGFLVEPETTVAPLATDEVTKGALSSLCDSCAVPAALVLVTVTLANNVRCVERKTSFLVSASF